MTSWKLMAAAIKAQRTWANLTPAQKAEVRKAAQKAAANAYTRMNDARQPAPAPNAQSGAPAPPPAQGTAPSAAPSLADAETPGTEQPASEAPGPEQPGTDAEPGFVDLARAHGPRLARQAAANAATRSKETAGQLADFWRRTQRP